MNDPLTPVPNEKPSQSGADSPGKKTLQECTENTAAQFDEISKNLQKEGKSLIMMWAIIDNDGGLNLGLGGLPLATAPIWLYCQASWDRILKKQIFRHEQNNPGGASSLHTSSGFTPPQK